MENQTEKAFIAGFAVENGVQPEFNKYCADIRAMLDAAGSDNAKAALLLAMAYISLDEQNK